jgi:hypothetical protein
MFFSDLHVQLLSRGILNPGEQLLGQTVTGYMPWWAFGFIRRQYLVLATDQRLILVDHRWSLIQPTTQRLHAIDSLSWSNVQEAKVKGLFLKKKLKVRGIGERGPVALSMTISNTLFGLLAPMKGNMQGAKTVAQIATQSMQGGAPALGPASQHQQQYGAPPSFQPAQLQQPSYPPQGAYAPPMPQINAPGYTSMPPAPPQYGHVPQQYGAPPAPSPFDPPRQY